MTKRKQPVPPSDPEAIRAIVRKNWFGAVDALGCLALLAEADRSEAIQSPQHPAHRAADLAARALLARVALWTARAFDPLREEGDQHLGVAFLAMRRHAGLRESLTVQTEAVAMHLAHQRWALLEADPRVGTIRHYRNKYLAHLSQPEPGRDLPFVGEVTGLTQEVGWCCAQLAHATGFHALSLEGQVAVFKDSAEAFWPDRRSLPMPAGSSEAAR